MHHFSNKKVFDILQKADQKININKESYTFNYDGERHVSAATTTNLPSIGKESRLLREENSIKMVATPKHLQKTHHGSSVRDNIVPPTLYSIKHILTTLHCKTYNKTIPFSFFFFNL